MDIKRLYSAGTIIVICAIIATIQAASAVPTMSVEPSYLSVSEGDTFTVNITVYLDGTEISGADYILCFNNMTLKAISQNKGPFLGGTVVANEIDNPNGRVDYGEYRVGSSGVTCNGTLATIEFEVTCAGVSELRFEDVILSDPDGNRIQDVIINSPMVALAQPEPSTPFLIRGSVSYKDGSECNDPTVNITNLNTSKEWTAETNETSNYYQIMLTSGIDLNASEVLRFDATDGVYSSVTNHTITTGEVGDGGLFEFNITLGPRPGDVNGDGEVTSADAVIALKMAVCGEYDLVADVNKDHVVTSLDALMIMQAADGGTINIALGCR